MWRTLLFLGSELPYLRHWCGFGLAHFIRCPMFEGFFGVLMVHNRILLVRRHWRGLGFVHFIRRPMFESFFRVCRMLDNRILMILFLGIFFLQGIWPRRVLL